MTATLLSIVLTLWGWQSAAPSAASAAGAGEIRGRVTDGETGRALLSATVILSRSESSTTTGTDQNGVFRFAGLAAGEYRVSAAGGPFHGRYSIETLSRAQAVALRAGEVREVTIPLPRAFAITVRVLDAWGEPLSDVSVDVRSAGGGQRFMWTQRATDDEGRLRIFGVPPGRYTVCAEANRLGSFAPGSRPAPRERLLATCYPSAGDAAEAEPVVVSRGDVGELEIRMRQGRTFTISGRIIDAAGAPAARVSADLDRYYDHGSSGIGMLLGADGRFRIDDVPSGTYAIRAAIGGPDRPDGRRYEAAFVPVRVDSSDVEDVLVTMSRGVDVTGRVVLEEQAVEFPRTQGSGLYVTARLAVDRLPNDGSTLHAWVAADRTFTLSGAFGSRVLDVSNVPRGWYVKSIRYGTTEVIDAPVEFKDRRNAPALDVVLSNRGAVLSGRVIDDRGNPARAVVMLFRVTNDASPPVLASYVSVPATGALQIGPVRGGEYMVVVLPPTTPMLQAGEWERAARLAALGEPLTLSDVDERTVELRLATVK